MGLLSNADKEKIKRAIPKSSNKIIDVTIARLYVAYPNPNEWQYTGLAGAIVLVDDIVGNTFFLKLVDIEGHRGVLWDQELYVGFEYTQDRTFFHSFELEECYAGLLFEDISEAGHFMKRVQRREKYGSKKTLSNKNAIALTKKLEEEKASQVVHGPRGEPLITDQRRRYVYNSEEVNVDSVSSMRKKAPPPPPPAEASVPVQSSIPPEAPPAANKRTLPPLQPPAVNQQLLTRNVSRMSSVPQAPSVHPLLSEPSDSMQDDDTTSSDEVSDYTSPAADASSMHEKEEHRPKYQLPPPPAQFFPLQPPAPAPVPAPTAAAPTMSNAPRLPERTLPPANFQPAPPLNKVHPVPPVNERSYPAPIPPQHPGSVPVPTLPGVQSPTAFPAPSRPQPAVPLPPTNSARVPPPPPARRGTGPPPPPRRGGPSSFPKHPSTSATGRIPPSLPRRGAAPPPPPRAARSAALSPNQPPQHRIAAPVSHSVPQQTYQAPPPANSMHIHYTDSVPPPPPPPPSYFTPSSESPNHAQQLNGIAEKTGDASRDALLASIRGAGGIGALRKVDKSQLDKPSVLLQEARGEETTKTGAPSGNPAGGAAAPGGSLADALAAALDKRKNKVRQGADDQENGDDW